MPLKVPCRTTISLPPIIPKLDTLSVLNRLDLSLKMGKKKYEEALEKYQGKLNLLTREAAFRQISVVLVFEGLGRCRQGEYHPPDYRWSGRTLLPGNSHRGPDR